MVEKRSVIQQELISLDTNTLFFNPPNPLNRGQKKAASSETALFQHRLATAGLAIGLLIPSHCSPLITVQEIINM
jgi:hypothetical protein